MVDRYAILEELGKLTYKPGWEMRFSDRGDILIMQCQAPVRDSRALGQGRSIQQFQATMDWERFSTRGRMSPMSPVSWVATMIVRMETHEALEFLQLDGEMVLDPHQEPLDGTLDVQPADRRFRVENPILWMAEGDLYRARPVGGLR